MVPEGLEAVWQLTGFLGVVDGVGEKIDKPVEGELVHGIQGGQVPEGEEENRGSDGDGTVAKTSGVDLQREMREENGDFRIVLAVM